MGLIFKKNGRPTKAEKGVLKNIKTFLSAIDEGEQAKYDFINETVTDGKRLTEIWDKIISGSDGEVVKQEVEQKIKEKAAIPPKPVIVEEFGEKVDVDTGEIIEKNEEITQEESNFVNNNTMEESQVLDEAAQSTQNVDAIPTMFNPLADPIKQRSYNKANETNVGEIKEPKFDSTPPPEKELEDLAKNQETFKKQEEGKKEEQEKKENPINNITNEAVNELEGKDKKLATKQLVTTVLDGYEMLHELGKNFVKYPEDKLREKIMSKKIDPEMTLPIDASGTEVGVVEFFEGFNQQAEEAISYDPAFGEKVRPAMERVFAKRGWGMTDEQFLMVAFGKDIAWKGVQIASLKKTANAIVDAFERVQKEKIAHEKKAQREYVEPIRPDSITTPPPPQREEPKVYHTEETHNEEHTEEGNNQTQEESISNSDIVPIH